MSVLGTIHEASAYSDPERKAMYVGAKAGMSPKLIGEFANSVKETGVLLFKSDADIVKYYSNGNAESERAQTLSAAMAMGNAAKSAKTRETAEKAKTLEEKEAKKGAKPADKQAERYEKAKALPEKETSGYTNDGYEI